MSIKEILLSESKQIKIEAGSVDPILESVNLSEDVKDAFKEVFQSTVQKEAAKLAEAHVSEIAERAESLVEAAAEEKIKDLQDTINDYFDHLTEQFMEENKVAIENGLKCNLTESLLSSLKEAFVAHNVSIPEESIDVVSEMESELQESRDQINELLSKNRLMTEEIQDGKRKKIIAESLEGLTDIQKERVSSLAEGMTFDKDDSFKTKIGALVEMVSVSKDPKEKSLNEDDKGLNYDEKDEKGEKDEKENKEDKGEKKPPVKKKEKIDESVASLMSWM